VITIGIDNGTTTGGMVALSPTGAIIGMQVMPWTKHKSRKEIDILKVHQWIVQVTGMKEWAGRYIIEEPNNSRNASTAYSVASCFHALRGYFTTRNLEWARITPQSWQKYMLGKVPKGETKERALSKAHYLWPDEPFHASPRCKTAHEGLVDAALIAEYYRLKNS
jgi:hypothetical protein